MKNYFSILKLFVCALLISSCDSCNEPKKGDVKSHEMQLVPTPFGDVTDPVGSLYDTSIKVRDAIKYIRNYKTNTVKNTSYLSFCVSADDLLKYIGEHNSSIVHLMLGEDDYNKLCLIISPVDSKGKHYYFSNDTNSTCYVMSSAKRFSAPEELEAPVVYMPDIYYIGAMDIYTAQDAINEYKRYIMSAENKIGGESWLYNGLDLAGYITAAQGKGVKYIQFSLAKFDIKCENITNSKIDFIISGVDATNRHLYFDYNDKPCVLENCRPCPVCETYSGGAILEQPKCPN